MTDLTNETELRRLAEKRVDAKAGFLIHAAIFVVVNAGMALGALATTPWFWWSAGCWGLALAGQGIAAYLPVRGLRQKAVAAEMAKLRAAAGR